MRYIFYGTLFLFFAVFSTLSTANNMAAEDIGEEIGVISVPSIVLTIYPSGIVFVEQELIVRKGDISRILLPSNVQGLELLDSKGNIVVYERVPRGEKELISFIVEDNSRNKTEEKITLTYNTQQLTGKFGDTWEINYSATVTPIGSPMPATVLRVKTPQNTQITKIDFKDFYWSPRGGSEIEIYPLSRNFNLYFQYRLGVAGPLIPRPNETTTSVISTQTTTTIPSSVDQITLNYLVTQINNIYYLLTFGIILIFLLALSALFLRHRRLREQLKTRDNKYDEGHGGLQKNEGIVDSGAVFSIESTNHDFEVLQPNEGLKGVEAKSDESGDDKEEFVDSPKEPHKSASGPRKLKESIRNVLDEAELKVVDMLLKFDEEITQAYIYKTTGIPKSSLSDIIKRLEKRNIIERKREGRINWIKLKDSVLE